MNNKIFYQNVGIIAILMLFSHISLYSQKDKFPVRRYNEGYSFGEIRESQQEAVRVYSQSLGLTYTSLVLPDKSQNEIGLNASFNNRFIVAPVMADIDFSRFISSGALRDAISLEGTLNFALPVRRRSGFFMPYLGAGYSYIGITDYNMSNPLAKAGFMLNFRQNFFMDFQYKQTIPLQHAASISQIGFSIGTRGKPLAVTWEAIGCVALLVGAIVLSANH